MASVSSGGFLASVLIFFISSSVPSISAALHPHQIPHTALCVGKGVGGDVGPGIKLQHGGFALALCVVKYEDDVGTIVNVLVLATPPLHRGTEV